MVVKENDVDLLSNIYQEMNEKGKEKLKEVSDQIMNIWSTVNSESIKSDCTENKKGDSNSTKK
jgi:hypothetical protein